MQVMEGHIGRSEWKRLYAPSSGNATERFLVSGRDCSARIKRGIAESSLYVCVVVGINMELPMWLLIMFFLLCVLALWEGA